MQQRDDVGKGIRRRIQPEDVITMVVDFLGAHPDEPTSAIRYLLSVCPAQRLLGKQSMTSHAANDCYSIIPARSVFIQFLILLHNDKYDTKRETHAMWSQTCPKPTVRRRHDMPNDHEKLEVLVHL
jgi:hypothetical protein